MRANGVRSLAIWCSGQGQHYRVFDVRDYPDDVAVPWFGPRMVCTVCGAIGADARPNWNECTPPALFGSGQHSLVKARMATIAQQLKNPTDRSAQSRTAARSHRPAGSFPQGNALRLKILLVPAHLTKNQNAAMRVAPLLNSAMAV
jgi:hypothetical protein